MKTYELAGIELETPLINAAGSVNGPAERLRREADLLSGTPLGAKTYGSFTIPPRPGNEEEFGAPVFIFDPETGRSYNSIGLGNVGSDEAVDMSDELIERSDGKPVIYSGSPTNAPEHGSSAEQAVKLATQFLDTNVDLVEINVGCPNIVTDDGGRKPVMGLDIYSMSDLFDIFEKEIGIGERLGLKLPPYLTEEERQVAAEIADMANESSIFKYLVGPNTILGGTPPDHLGQLSVPGNTGGVSGPDTKEVGREQLTMWRDMLNPDIDFVSTEGVFNGSEMSLRLKLGANAVGGVTFLWVSKDWKDAITNMLIDFYPAEHYRTETTN
jgi:dihydroorotate dehydrogenase